MTEETDVKNYLRKELKRLSDVLGIPITVLANPASTQSEQGRADCDIIINNVIYVHAEIKAEGKGLSLNQEIFFAEERFGFLQTCLSGKTEVDLFIGSLPQMLMQTIPHLQAEMIKTTAIIHEHHDQYLQDRSKRESAAAKRPQRQSKRVH